MKFDESELSMFRMLSADVEICCGCLVFQGEVEVCMRYLYVIFFFSLLFLGVYTFWC